MTPLMTPLEYEQWALEKILEQSTPKISPIAQEMMKAKAPTVAPSSPTADEIKRKKLAAYQQQQDQMTTNAAVNSTYYLYYSTGTTPQQQQQAATSGYQTAYIPAVSYPLTLNTPEPPQQVVPDDAFWTELHEEFMDFSYRLCGYRYIKASKEMYAYGYILPKELAFQFSQPQLAKIMEVATLDLQAALYSDDYWKFKRIPGNYIQFERLPDDIIAVGRIDGD
jgi:hypothetical protein